MSESYSCPAARAARNRYSRTMSDDAPRLHVDSDWKAQAQAEKERLAEREASRPAPADADAGEPPPADFRTLVATLASQAMMGLGAYGDPQTGRVVIDLAGAQFAIDLLGVLEEKTKGNLNSEETKELAEILAQLRARFVQIARLVEAQMRREMASEAAGVADPGVIGSIGGSGGAFAGGARPAPSTPSPASTPARTKPSGLIIPD